MSAMIELRQVSKTLPSGGRPLAILHPLDVSIPAGQFVTIMGPSGSGKSTLLGLIAGLDSPSAGDITVNGQSLARMNEDQLARFRGQTIGFVFQTFQLIPTLTALENVMVPLEIARRPDARTRAESLIELVGLSGRTGHYPAQLSGGEQQRVAIARAFACQPTVLLADEPTGNLDSTNGTHILDLLGQLHREQGITIVLVTHDPEVAKRADRVIQLRDGSVLDDRLNGNGAGIGAQGGDPA
jgi:putative ABC transport system ATP-binding protein